MKIYYDKEVDAAYIRLSDENPSGVIEVLKESMLIPQVEERLWA